MDINPLLIEGPIADASQINQLYEFYLKIWADTWGELQVNAVGFQDDFHRFRTKFGLVHDGKVIAFHGYGEFDLRIQADREHSYFKKVNAPIAEMLFERGYSKIATLEYMAVDPKYRKIANQHVGEILGVFSAQYLRTEPYDAIITVTRNDRGINSLCKRYGAFPLFGGLSLHNVEVDVMVFEPDNILDVADPEIQQIVNRLLTLCGRRPSIGVAA